MAGEVRVRFVGDYASLDKAMSQLGAKTQVMGQSLNQLEKNMAKIGSVATSAGTALTAGLTAPLLAIGAVSAKAAIQFESAFAGVRKTVDASTSELAALNQGFRDMAKVVPLSAVELAKVGEAAGQLGIKTDKILGFTKVMADMAVSTNMSADQAATSMAKLANITQMPQDQFDRLGATLVALGNAGASTEAEIVDMGLRIAGAGNQVGMTEAQILGVANALSSVGIEAEMGGSAISRAMIEMASAVNGGGVALRQYADVAGMTSREFATAFKGDAASALTEFISGLGKVKEQGGSVLQVLEEMGIKEIRLRDTLLRAAGAGELMAKSIQLGSKAWAENSALTKEATERYKTTESQLLMLKNRLTDVAISFGNALKPSIELAIGALTRMIPHLESGVKWFTALPPAVQLAAVGFTGIAAAIGPALMAFGMMATGASQLIAAYKALAAIQWATMFGGIGAAAATAAGGVAAFAAVLGQIAMAAGIGLAIGSIIRLGLEFVGLAKYIDKAVDSLYQWINGNNQVAEMGDTKSMDQGKITQQYFQRVRAGNTEGAPKWIVDLVARQSGSSPAGAAAAGGKKGDTKHGLTQTTAAATEAEKALEKLNERMLELGGHGLDAQMDLDMKAIAQLGGFAEIAADQLDKLIKTYANTPHAIPFLMEDARRRAGEAGGDPGLINSWGNSVFPGKGPGQGIPDRITTSGRGTRLLAANFANPISFAEEYGHRETRGRARVLGEIWEHNDEGERTEQLGWEPSRQVMGGPTIGGPAMQGVWDAFNAVGDKLPEAAFMAADALEMFGVSATSTAGILSSVATSLARGDFMGAAAGMFEIGNRGGVVGNIASAFSVPALAGNLLGGGGQGKQSIGVLMEDISAGALAGEKLSDALADVGSEFNRLATAAAAAGSIGDVAIRGMIQRADELGVKVPEIQAHITAQNDLIGRSLGGAFEAMTPVTEEQARAQATIFAVSWEAAVKERGLVGAANLLGDAFKTLQGGQFDVSGVLGPIAGQVQAATNEQFAGAAQSATLFRDVLQGLGNQDIPLTVQQMAAFGTQAQAAYDQAYAGAVASGMGHEQAVQAAFGAVGPLLVGIQSAATNYGLVLDDNTKRLLDQGAANGVAFPTDPTDRLRSSIDALTRTLGGVPPAFGAIGESVNNLPRDVTIQVRKVVTTIDGGGEPAVPRGPDPDPGGGTPLDFSEADGTKAGGNWFRDYGAESVGALHDVEAIVPRSRAGEFVSDFLSQHGGGTGASTSSTSELHITIPVNIGGHQLDELIMRRTAAGLITVDQASVR